jgi:Holliday junction DNA helicase RuvB
MRFSYKCQVVAAYDSHTDEVKPCTARPADWDDFIGQPRAKAQLRAAAAYARLRGVPMRHVLLDSGTPGIGKTSLALLAAQECGAQQVKMISGRVKANQARVLLAGMADGDVLFIDEIHTLVAGGKADAEWLLNFLQDGCIVGPRGAEKQPRVTVIAATTDAGRLPETILSRFPIRPGLDDYTADEGAQIAKVLSRTLIDPPLPLPSPENLAAIARAAHNNPRLMSAIICNVRDVCCATEGQSYNEPHYDLGQALEWLGLTEDGLTNLACRYLKALYVDFNGEPVGAGAMQDMLREPGGVHHTEGLLLDMGLIVKTRQGRLLTQLGISRIRTLLCL